MKRQLILTFILALGIGVAAGSYFAPELRKVGAFLGPTTRTGDSSHAPTRSASSTQTSSSPLISDVALSSLLSEPTSFHQTDSLLAYVRSIAPEDIPDALRQIQKHTGGGRDQALSLLISRWVESDPKGAQDAITTTGDGQIRYLLTRTVFTALAVNDPTDAMRQARNYRPRVSATRRYCLSSSKWPVRTRLRRSQFFSMQNRIMGARSAPFSPNGRTPI